MILVDTMREQRCCAMNCYNNFPVVEHVVSIPGGSYCILMKKIGRVLAFTAYTDGTEKELIRRHKSLIAGDTALLTLRSPSFIRKRHRFINIFACAFCCLKG